MSEFHFGHGHFCGCCNLSESQHNGCPPLKHSITEFKQKSRQKPALFGSEFEPDHGSRITKLINTVEESAGYKSLSEREPINSNEYVMSMIYALQKGVPAEWEDYFGRIYLLEHRNGEIPHYSFSIEHFTGPVIIPGDELIVRSLPCILDGSKVFMPDTSIAPFEFIFFILSPI